MDNFESELSALSHIKTSNGEYAWTANVLSEVLLIAQKHQRIVLGGDVLYLSGEYTYDNWYYLRKSNESYIANVEASITMCKQYVSRYLQSRGESFAFVLVFGTSQRAESDSLS